jgi:uncharacterized protein
MAVPASSRVWVDEAVGVLVAEFSPVKIFLFGSRARGDGHEESDIDLLVVLDRIEGRRESRDALRKALPRLPVSVDVFAADAAHSHAPATRSARSSIRCFVKGRWCTEWTTATSTSGCATPKRIWRRPNGWLPDGVGHRESLASTRSRLRRRR